MSEPKFVVVAKSEPYLTSVNPGKLSRPNSRGKFA